MHLVSFEEGQTPSHFQTSPQRARGGAHREGAVRVTARQILQTPSSAQQMLQQIAHVDMMLFKKISLRRAHVDTASSAS